MNLTECYVHEPQKPKDWNQLGSRAYDCSLQSHLHASFRLCNPHEPMFADYEDDLGIIQRRALAKAPGLPKELQDWVLGYVYQDKLSVVGDLNDTD